MHYECASFVFIMLCLGYVLKRKFALIGKFQVANEMREPREAECMAVLQEVGPILEESLRIARSSPLFGSNNIVEGPLTWRFFDRKSVKSGTMVIFSGSRRE